MNETETPPLHTRGIMLRAFEATTRCASFVASTDAIDSYDEIVDQSSWDLSAFVRNPVVLFAHKSRELPIGRCVDVATRNGQLECTIEFATAEMNPEAEKVWKLVQGGFLKAVSVGFMSTDYRFEKRDGKEVYVLYGNQLREISVTPIGANPEALMKARAKALAESKAVRTPAPTPPALPVASAQEKTPMDEETKKALAAKDLEIAALKAGSTLETESLRSAKASLEAEKVALVADKAALVESHKTALEAVCKALSAKDGETAEQAAARLVAEKSALVDTLTERDVDALIGVKLVPAQKDEFLALAKESRKRFDAIVECMPDLNILGRVIASDGTETRDVGDLADELGEPGDALSPTDDGDLSDEL